MLGVATLAGRKSILKLAQRMTWSFCHAIGASSFHTWTMVTSKTGEDIRISSRKNLNDPGEPLGVILSAVSSVWLPVSTNVLFDFLRDEARRSEVQLSASLLFFFFFFFWMNLGYSWAQVQGFFSGIVLIPIWKIVISFNKYFFTLRRKNYLLFDNIITSC